MKGEINNIRHVQTRCLRGGRGGEGVLMGNEIPEGGGSGGGGEGDNISFCSSHHQNDILHQIKTDGDVCHSSVIIVAVGVKCP